MTPIKFKEHNVVLAEDQPEYQPLPVHVIRQGQWPMTSCWKLTWRERIAVLFGKPLYIQQLTFGSALQPVYPTTNKKEVIPTE